MEMYKSAMYGDSSYYLIYAIALFMLYKAFKDGGIKALFQCLLILIAIVVIFAIGVVSLALIIDNLAMVFGICFFGFFIIYHFWVKGD
jgi:hypothetical protein